MLEVVRVVAFACVALVTFVLVGGASARGVSTQWAKRADSVCQAWKARTRGVRAKLRETAKPLAQHQDLTTDQWKYVFHTSLRVVVDRLRRLVAVPGPVPRLGQRALRLTKSNAAVLAAASGAFDAGNKDLAMRFFGIWAGDDRADPVWRALGAGQCI
jgi:hypothetical protein